MTRRRKTLLLAGALAAVCAGAAAYGVSALRPSLDLAAVEGRSSIVVDRHGQLLRAFTTADGRWRLPVARADIDPRYFAMLLAYEDKRFRAHPGVDPLAMGRAAWQFITSRQIVSGASTLSMQTARLVESRHGKSVQAKLSQMIGAVALEARVGKDGVLDLYIALAPFGGNVEGVRAASLAYFGKEPKRLTPGQAALLVALPQAPETRRPDRFTQAARRARDRVIDRAVLAGVLKPAEAVAAKEEAVPNERRAFPMLAAHAAEAAAQEQPAAVHRLTIDARLQAGLEALARERVQAFGPKVSAAIIAVDNATGEIRASVGGPQYLAPERAGGVDLTRAVRSPGSALKPFIYALAFENGIAHPETILEDRPNRFGLYAPENFELTFQGTVTARRALQMSLNIPAVDLLAAVGPQRFLARLRHAGADLVLPKDSAAGLAIALGGLGITLHDMAGLYSALARGGDVLPLTLRPRESLLPARRITDPAAAWYVADILRGAPPPSHAQAGKLAYKTGTSYGYRDAWAVGYDRQHTIAVWVGRPDNAAVPGLVGRVSAAPILFDAFARLGIDPEPFARPAGAIVAATSQLPPPLRHTRQDVPKIVSAMANARLRIAFPPDGAKLDLASSGSDARVPLKALGGAPPFTWLIDGKPLQEAQVRRAADWLPGSRGFARISIIDASGASDSVVIAVQ